MKKKILGDFFELQRGSTYKSSLLGKEGPFLLGLSSIERNGGFRSDNLKTYGGSCDDRMLLEPGDLFASLKDVTQSADLLGAVARVPAWIPLGRITQDTVKLKPKSKDFHLDYLYWILRTPQCRVYCKQHSTGTTNLGLAREDFLSFEIPDYTEERRLIVESLQKIDDKIELNRQMNRTLEEMARALFKSWFVDFDPVRAKAEGHAPVGMDADTAALFPDAFEDSELGEIPKGWGVFPLSSLSSYLSRGISPSYSDSGVCVLNQKCIRNYRIDFSKARRHDAATKSVDGRFLRDLDILINSTGVGTLGRMAQVFELEEETIVDSHITIVRSKNTLLSLFLGCFLIHNEEKIESMAEGSTGQTELSKSRLLSLSVLNPNSDVLVKFNDFCDKNKKAMSRLEKESETLKLLRDTLLPKLISGEMRVKDAEAFLAERRL